MIKQRAFWMSKRELACLVKVTYDSRCIDGKDWIYWLPINEYLKRRKILDSNFRPTKKMYKLLDKFGITINQLEKQQIEYRNTGKVNSMLE